MVGFGALRLVFTPDPVANKWVPLIDPPLPGLKIEGRVEWSEVRCPGPPVVTTDPVITQQGVTIRVNGKVAGSCGEFSLYRLALSQPDYATEVFRMLWKELGGTFKGQVRSGMVPPDAVVLATHDSPTLAEAIRQINKRSNNVMARTLLLTLGAERGRRPATVSSSEEVAKGLLAKQGLDMPELVIDNGAGLSRDARVSADSLASMLTLAWNSPVMPEYISSFAIAGVDGTVRRRLKGNGTLGMAHLKTGSCATCARSPATCWAQRQALRGRQHREPRTGGRRPGLRRRAHRLAGRAIEGTRLPSGAARQKELRSGPKPDYDPQVWLDAGGADAPRRCGSARGENPVHQYSGVLRTCPCTKSAIR